MNFTDAKGLRPMTNEFKGCRSKQLCPNVSGSGPNLTTQVFFNNPL
jgi:hypothetical protein